MDHLNAAIATAARYQIAAPEQAPSLEVNGAMGGAFIVGVIILAVMITKWRTQKMSDEAKKTMIWAVVMTVCLYTGSGLFGTVLDTIKRTADTTGNTITQTTYR